MKDRVFLVLLLGCLLAMNSGCCCGLIDRLAYNPWICDGGCGPECGPCGPCGPACGRTCGPCGPACGSCDDCCDPCGSCCGPCFRPLAGLFALLRCPPMWCGCGCSDEVYCGDFHGNPPDCHDPCDRCGNWTGRSRAGRPNGYVASAGPAGVADAEIPAGAKIVSRSDRAAPAGTAVAPAPQVNQPRKATRPTQTTQPQANSRQFKRTQVASQQQTTQPKWVDKQAKRREVDSDQVVVRREVDADQVVVRRQVDPQQVARRPAAAPKVIRRPADQEEVTQTQAISEQ